MRFSFAVAIFVDVVNVVVSPHFKTKVAVLKTLYFYSTNPQSQSVNQPGLETEIDSYMHLFGDYVSMQKNQ